MNEDFNTPVVIAQLFEGARIIHSVRDGHIQITETDRQHLEQLFRVFGEEILGLGQEDSGSNEKTHGLMELVIGLRKEAREKKDYATSDLIRDKLASLGISLKDEKGGTTYQIEN